jgi:Tfp pilus assembly protein PilE
VGVAGAILVTVLIIIGSSSSTSTARVGNDAEAKSTVVTAAEAMETCATDNNGSYTACSKAYLESIEPTLNDAEARLDVTSSTNEYQVVVTSNRDSNAATFTLSRLSDGTSSRTCDTGTADKGGCSAQYDGTW